MDAWMKAVLSLGIVLAALYIVLFKSEDRKARDWAFGAIGLILGYWLK